MDQFCLVRLALGAGILVSVCVVACLVRQNQLKCELNFLCGSHSLSVCVHASGHLQMDCGQTQLLKRQFVAVVRFLAFLTTWSRTTRLETRTKGSNVCASFREFNLQAQ